MPARLASRLPLALLLLLALPLASDAANRAACCAVADVPPPPAPRGDEDFFSIPGGVPNVMLLLDSSGSMLEFPNDLTFPSVSAGAGTCDGTSLEPFVSKRSATPYDNGWTTAEMTDNPPWGLARCTARQPEPAGDNVHDYCLYRPTSHYKYVSGVAMSGGKFWEDTRARVYNANPCAAVDANGNVIDNYKRVSGDWVKDGPALANELAECNACLASKGFYFFRATYRNSNGTSTNSTTQVVFRGDFLNGYPQKHIVARKVVKDLVKLDAADPSNVDEVRFGLTAFATSGNAGGFNNGIQTQDGGRLLVPLGPDCDASFPVSRTSFVQARQTIVNAINAVNNASNMTADWPSTYLPFSASTPLAEALFNVGQYFTNTGTSSMYRVLFGTNWVLPRTGDTRDFQETSRGLVTAPWTGSGRNQRSFCWACQQSSVVVVTDGEPNNDSNLPTSGAYSSAHAPFNNDFRYWSNPTIDCPACKCDLSDGDNCSVLVPNASGSVIPNSMHKVAYFLNQTDLRPDMSNGSRPQNVTTYTISFGIDPTKDPKAIAVLDKTAQLGGGLFKNTASGEELMDALNTAVTDVVSRATGFSSANANSLQTSKTTQADAYMGRFRPAQSSIWEGHLFAAMIFDEFGQGCDERFSTADQKKFSCGTHPDTNPNLNGDETADQKAVCGDAYIVDADCDPVLEDANGSFKKGTFDLNSHALVGSPDDANLFWDAGKVLSTPGAAGYRSAAEGTACDASDVTKPCSRQIHTVIDTNGDGRFTSADGLTDFTRANAATLAPFMSLDEPFCREQLSLAGVCGNSPLPACPAWSNAERTRCARLVIDFIRGWDVRDWDNDHCGGPEDFYNTGYWGTTCTTAAQCGAGATCTSGKCYTVGCPNGEERDRVKDSRAETAREFWKLGDIFHSSPILVRPPHDKIECNTGAVNQCVLTLYSANGQSATNVTPLEKYGLIDAYDAWRREFINRPAIVLVGANDGMLHAFDAGEADKSKTAGPEGQHPFGNGTGAERWSFIPPDLLPRLKLALKEHTYFVDGNTMVRDVWVDGAGAAKDGQKQKQEFRTVAVISERGGGTHFSALDITDPTAPRFLWTFPDGCTEDARLMGQSWSDFPPRAPPIGAVRLALPSNNSQDPQGRGFEERWVVMLNGGYDPAMVRGRAVWMLDVWSGGILWRFTDADFKALRGDAKASMAPVAATVALVDLGKAENAVGTYDTDAYFDTATWGDLTGQLFVARFHEPGTLGTDGRVTNWSAARTFEQERKVDDTQGAAGRSPFFFMTYNTLDPPSRLITSLGSGHREKLLAETPRCGPDNLWACCQAGCTVSSATTSASFGAGSCSMGGAFSCSAGGLSYNPTGGGVACAGAFSCGDNSQTVTLDFDCGAAGNPDPFTATLTCNSDGVCSTDTKFPSHATLNVTAQTTPHRDAFYGIWAYGVAPEKRFTTGPEAKTFDGNRFTDVTFSGCGTLGTCSLVNTSPAKVSTSSAGVTTTCLDNSTKCRAASGDPGWFYEYGRYCPAKSCSETSWWDERTGSGAVGIAGGAACMQFSSFRPTGSTATSDPCSSTTGNPTSFSYLTDPITGTPTERCGFFDGTTYQRGAQKNAFSPPQAGSIRVVVNEKGEVNYSVLKIETGSGAEKIGLGQRSSVNEPLYWLEVPRLVHNCRHETGTACK